MNCYTREQIEDTMEVKVINTLLEVIMMLTL